jgi:hypothetical protein
MEPNYQPILALMNLMLMACAGFTIIGCYRILKVFGLVPWEDSAHGEMTFSREKDGLDTDLMLPNLRVVGTAFIPGGKAPTRVLPGMPAAGTVLIPEVKTRDQAVAVQCGE